MNHRSRYFIMILFILVPGIITCSGDSSVVCSTGSDPVRMVAYASAYPSSVRVVEVNDTPLLQDPGVIYGIKKTSERSPGDRESVAEKIQAQVVTLTSDLSYISGIDTIPGTNNGSVYIVIQNPLDRLTGYVDSYYSYPYTISTEFTPGSSASGQNHDHTLKPREHSYFSDTIGPGEYEHYVQLNWTDPDTSLKLNVYPPDGILGPYSDIDDGKNDSSIFLRISGDKLLEPGKWYYDVNGMELNHSTGFSIQTYQGRR